MQRTSEAISFIHGKQSFLSRPYLDNFGGAKATGAEAQAALGSLQRIMFDLGMQEAKHKTRGLTQSMVWLGLLYDSIRMTISIPPEKMEEIMLMLAEWEGKQRATRG